jgi:hypothetical protein
MPKRRKCAICRRLFTPDSRIKERQKTCTRPECRGEQKRQMDELWRSQNRDYFRNLYPQQKQAYGTRAEYRKRYRKEHPDYVQRNAAYVKECRRRHTEKAAIDVSSTSCDLRLTVCSQTSNVKITHVSHTSRDILVTVCEKTL